MLRKIKSIVNLLNCFIVLPKAADWFCCGLSALFLVIPFCSPHLWIFAWVGFVPLFFALENKSRKEAFRLAYICGIVFWIGTIYWLVHVTFLGQVFLILYLALYFAVFGLLFRSFIGHRPLAAIPSAWVILEYIRSHLLTGFGWALLGYSQQQNLPVIQIADIIGAWGVSFLVMMVNAAVYSVIRSPSSAFRKKNYIALLCLVIVLIYGYYKIYELRHTHEGTKTTISVIQGNIPQELKWNPQARPYILEKYRELTREAAVTKPDLIVWPEASNPEILGEEDSGLLIFSSLAKEIKIPLLIGTVIYENERYFNSALLVDSQGSLAQRYDKLHLVPFGEYIPLKKALPFLEQIVPIGDMNPGREYTIFKIPNYKITNNFAVLICFEDLFPRLSREFVRRGADFLINITNDAWYKKTTAAYQHFQASVFRAVENRVFLVRSANTGISGFISPEGRAISLVQDKFDRKIFITGFETKNIEIVNRPLTLYTRYGDYFVIFCCLILLIFLLLNYRQRIIV